MTHTTGTQEEPNISVFKDSRRISGNAHPPSQTLIAMEQPFPQGYCFLRVRRAILREGIPNIISQDDCHIVLISRWQGCWGRNHYSEV